MRDIAKQAELVRASSLLISSAPEVDGSTQWIGARSAQPILRGQA